MSRALAIVLLLLFGSTLTAPLFALGQSDTALPACCRRSGQHHCAMRMSASVQSGRSFGIIPQRCPMLPKSIAPLQGTFFSPIMAAAQSLPRTAHPQSPQQTAARYRLSFSRSRQKRGPPSILLQPLVIRTCAI